MKEYIDRNALLKDICGNDPSHMEDYYFNAIANAPTADVVEVMHGHWKYNPNGMDLGLGAWECSLCRCRNDNLPMDEKINPRIWAGTKFCPNCGAKMDGERKEQKENV